MNMILRRIDSRSSQVWLSRGCDSRALVSKRMTLIAGYIVRIVRSDISRVMASAPRNLTYLTETVQALIFLSLFSTGACGATRGHELPKAIRDSRRKINRKDSNSQINKRSRVAEKTWPIAILTAKMPNTQ